MNLSLRACFRITDKGLQKVTLLARWQGRAAAQQEEKRGKRRRAGGHSLLGEKEREMNDLKDDLSIAQLRCLDIGIL